MASRSSQTPVKRLLVELQSYQSDPNDALQRLGPVNDDELTHWQAVMKGVSGTPYESMVPLPHLPEAGLTASVGQTAAGFSTSASRRRTRSRRPRSSS